MRQFNDAFIEAMVNASSADVRFTIEIQWDSAGTQLVYLLSHSDSGAPSGADTIHSIHSIASTSQTLNNRYAIAEIGNLSFTLADVADGITAELASRFGTGITFVGKKCTVYMGTEDLDWVDYEPIDTWFIDDCSQTGPGYRFRASDVQRLLRQEIFTPDKSRLSASMTSTQSYIPLTLALSSTKFPAIAHDANYTYNASTTVGYVKIDDEIIAHDGTFTNTVDGPGLTVIERGALGTAAAAHETDDGADEDEGKEVEEIIYIEGTVVDLIHYVLTGENLAGTDTIPDHWQAGVDTDFIDSSTFTSINNEMPNRRYSFIGEKDRDVKQFVEQQCMRFYGLFQTVTSQGTLRLQRYERTLTETAPVAQISDDQGLISIGNIDQRWQDVINVYHIDYNYDYLSERHTRGLNFLDSTSYNANGQRIKDESFTFRGVRTALHSDNDLRNFIYQTRELYSNPPYRTRIKVDRRHLGVEVGDVVNVVTSTRKDYASGDTTLDHPFMATRRSVDLESGETTLELIGTGLAAEAILDPGAAGSTGELTNAWLTSEGTDLESLANISSGTLTGDVTLTGGSDITAAGSIWYLDDNLVIPDGFTLFIANNVQIRVTGQIAVQNGGAIRGNGRGLSGVAFGGGATPAGYFGTSKAGAGEQQAPAEWWHREPDIGVINTAPDTAPVVGEVQSIPFYNLRNRDGTLEGLPTDLRGTPGGPGRAIGTPGTGDGGDGGDGGTGLITISRGFTVGATGVVDLSGAGGTAGDTDTVSTPSGNITLYGGGGGGGMPGGHLCIIDGDFSGPTSDQITADRGDSPWASPRDHNRTGFESRDMAAAAYRLQYVPALKPVSDTGETGVQQLGQVTGVAVASGADYIIVHDNGSVSERARVTWDELIWAPVDGYQLQARRTGDPDWVTQHITQGSDDTFGFVDIEDGVQYDVRVRAFSNRPNVIPGDWSATVTHNAVGASTITQLTAPQNVTIQSGTAQLKQLNDGTIVERMRVSWDANADQYWYATEVEFQEDGASSWEQAAWITDQGVTSVFIEGLGGTDYNVRLRHRGTAAPSSNYTQPATHTLVGKTAVPDPPTNLVVTAGQVGLATVSWDAPSDLDLSHFQIRYDGSDWASSTFLANSDTTEFVISSLDDGTYTIRVKAVDTSGNESITHVSGQVTIKTAFNDKWVYVQKLVDPADDGANLGRSVAISADGNYVFAEGTGGGHNVEAYFKEGAYSHQQALSLNANASVITHERVAASADGDRILVGDGSEIGGGQLFVMFRDGGSYSTEQQLTASDQVGGDAFGDACAINADGDALVASALLQADDGGGDDEVGAVYYFTRSGTTWTEQQRLQPGGLDQNARYGEALALSADGNTLAVGAYQADNGANTNAGLVWTYDLSGGSWGNEQQLSPDSGINNNDNFGVSVSLSEDGEKLAVGASSFDATPTVGAVFIFTRSGAGAWSQAQRIDPPSSGTIFGRTVLLSKDGARLYVGATVNSNTQGRVYVYNVVDGDFAFKQTLSAPDAVDSNNFGLSTALSDDNNYLAIGAPGAGALDGAVYVYNRVLVPQ